MIWIAQLGGSNETASSPCQNTALRSFFSALLVSKIGKGASLAQVIQVVGKLWQQARYFGAYLWIS